MYKCINVYTKSHIIVPIPKSLINYYSIELTHKTNEVIVISYASIVYDYAKKKYIEKNNDFAIGYNFLSLFVFYCTVLWLKI